MINSVCTPPSNCANLMMSPAVVGTTGGTFTLWQQTMQSISTLAFPLGMRQDLSTVCIAPPAQPVSCLQGGQIRPVPTSYGLAVVFSSTTGFHANDYWTLPVTGVPPTHGAFASALGSADYFAIISPMNGGLSQPSQSIQFNSTSSSGTPLQSTMNLDSSGNFMLTPPLQGRFWLAARSTCRP